jgi:hypothetical protein
MPSVTIKYNILSVTMRSAVMLSVVAPITVMPISVVPNNLLYDRCREELYPRKRWFSIKTLSMAVFSMKSLFVTPRINNAKRKLILSITIRGIKCRHAECYILFIFILIVVMLSVITLNVVMLSVVGPSVEPTEAYNFSKTVSYLIQTPKTVLRWWKFMYSQVLCFVHDCTANLLALVTGDKYQNSC